MPNTETGVESSSYQEKNRQGITKENHDMENPAYEVPTNPSRVRVSIKRTIPTSVPYSSISVEVMIERPCNTKDEDAVYEELKQNVATKMVELLDDAGQNL